MDHVVLDPGVLISALISPKGAPASLYLRWRRGDFELIVSPLLLDELERVLNRPRFRTYVTADEASEYLETVRREAIIRPDPPDRPRVCRDPKDDYLVALARPDMRTKGLLEDQPAGESGISRTRCQFVPHDFMG